MGAGTITIYSASAGSGKTYSLAGAYLEKLFTSRFSYRRILAVTFTHKATAEMKNRILDELNNLAEGKESRYLPDLLYSTGKSAGQIRREAMEILYLILHDYSRFSISTIDSFFQKILRAFTRDIGIHSGFNIELDHTTILSSAVDRLMASAATDPGVRKWLAGYVRANIEDEKTWDIRKSIISLSNELFNEKFRLLPKEEKLKIRDKDFLTTYIKKVRLISTRFESDMVELGKKCLSIFSRFNLQDEMFYYKGHGVPAFVRALANGDLKAPNCYVREIESNPPRWSTGPAASVLVEALREGLEISVREAIHYYDDNIVKYRSAKAILSNVYTLGILSDVLNQVHAVSEDENIFLLSDTGELIYLITEKDQAPFIYEKVGNTFENYMIDEFQDTSVIQWNNFKMLIGNSMAQGFDNLVVGDIKQSIYRWRNGNWQTLHNLRNNVDDNRFISRPLNTNWRSCSQIINFNNSLFSIIPHLLDIEFREKGIASEFSDLFSEAVQIDPGRKDKGYVRIDFVESTDQSDWRDIVLDRLPNIIKAIQSRGYGPSDIGILVRDNREGAAVLKKIIDLSSSLPDDEKRIFNIVSNDSLLLINSPVINFIVSVLIVLDNPGNLIGRALMLRNFLLATGKCNAETAPLDCENLASVSAEFFPQGYEQFLENLRYLTLWDITEKTILFFGLGEYSFNVAYLTTFQDIIIHFTAGKNPGVSSFLDWWQTEGYKKSISLPEHQEAIRVLTIHKSKGLEFEVVILPFLCWNLDHKSWHSNIIWVKPDSPPFDELGIVPVKYGSDLGDTIFSKDYFKEKYSAYIDNINLLYVALTRAKNGIFGFAPDNPGSEGRIAGILKDALEFNEAVPGKNLTSLCVNYYPDKKIFEFGDLPENEIKLPAGKGLKISNYPVNNDLGSLKLKLHWENYLMYDKDSVRLKVNYGKLMHEIYEEILTIGDIEKAVKKKVLEGKINEDDEALIAAKISGQIIKPGIKEWFDNDNVVLNEASILLPGTGTKRPDRIIIKNGKTIIVDFKFGEENPHYLSQIRNYKNLLAEMGYFNIEAFLWYVDSDKIVSA